MSKSPAQVALVTGGAQRVGAETVRTLHAAGLNLIIHYRNSISAAEELKRDLENDRPDSVALLQSDLLDIQQLPKLVEAASSQWGHLDLLVNNASSFYPTPVGEITESTWDDLIGSNLKAPLFLSQAAAPYLRQRRGAIINMVDIHAERPLREHSVYCIAKAGLVMLTRTLAAELGPDIRVNAVAPGAILWPENGMNTETKNRIVKRTFLKRQGTPKDIAKAILFLFRDASYTTGEVLRVDGGRSLNS